MTEFRKFVRYSEIMVNKINEQNDTVRFSMYTTYKNSYKNSKKETIYILVYDTNNVKRGPYDNIFCHCSFKVSRPVFDKCSKQVQIVDGKEEVFDTKDFTISIFEVMMKKILAGENSDLVMTYKE